LTPYTKKVIVIGATGTIGSAVARALEATGHEVVRASRTGPIKVDLADLASIDELFVSVRDVDAIVSVAASVRLKALTLLSEEDIMLDLKSKLIGQIALLRRATHYLHDGGSITLTSGTFKVPMPGSAMGALVNAGLEGFVRSAALDMPRGLRVNVVSPGWVKETLESLGLDSAEGTPVGDVARAYIASVEGTMQGQTILP
jgi:NAD(P)-dependent dehydrogenase (short-subunit alcohol dehydrogenase family)